MSEEVKILQAGVTIKRHLDYIDVRASPETIEDFKQLLRQVVDECSESGRWKALVDVSSVEIPLTTIQRFLLGELWAAEAPPMMKVAVVARPPSLDVRRFGETVARNRGANARVFASREDAERWLLAEEE